MKNYKYQKNESGKYVPYLDFSTTSCISWASTSSSPLSVTERHRVPFEVVDAIIVMNNDVDLQKQPTIRKMIPESEAILTMIASEEVLGREWNTPEEDEAWANL